VRSLASALFVLGAASVPRHAFASSSDDLASILDNLDDLYRAKSSHGTLTMHVVKASAARDLTVEQWSKGQEKFLMRILSPEKERGISTLASGSEAWSFFPKVNQVTKLTSSMLAASWMGSHLTNNEIVKRSRLSRDYTPNKTFEGDRDGASVLEITCDPKGDAPVVWGRVVVLVRRSDKIPIKLQYFDEAKKLKQTVTFGNEKMLGGRSLPSTMKFVNVDRPDEYTEVKWTNLDFDVKISDEKFSLRALQK
jgi:outer membrane lipoprotein-sorting protein